MRTLQHSLLGLVVLTGCHRQIPFLPGSSYRLTKLAGEPLLLPPPLVNSNSDKPLSVPFAITRGASNRECEGDSSEYVTFRVTKSTAELTMPSLDVWQKLLLIWQQPNSGIDRGISNVLGGLEALETGGCLSSGSALVLRQLVRDTIPLRPGFDLYSAYGYGPGSIGLDIRPGVRLKVQRAHFSGRGTRPLDGFLGLTTVYYEPVVNRGGEIGFRRTGVEFSTEGVRSQVENPDLELSRDKRRHRLYRLLFLTTYVATGVKRAALVVGSSSIVSMQTMEQRLMANPKLSCDELTKGTSNSCVSYEGEVTVTAEVQVTLNGESKYVDFGTSIRSALRGKGEIRDLRLTRNFRGRMLPVTIDPAVEQRLEDLVLVGGDELTWTAIIDEKSPK